MTIQKGFDRKLVVFLSLLCLLLSACQPKQPASETPAQTTEAAVPEIALADSVLIRITMRSTSDWAVLSLVSGAAWQDVNVLSADEGATVAAFRDEQLFLEQPIERAEAGERVEMVVEAGIKARGGGDPGIFKIERGNLGSAHLEFSRQAGEKWVVIETIDWGEITGDGTNAHTFELSARDLFAQVMSAPASSHAEAGEGLMPQGTDGYPWWDDTVFYEISVRSFYDSNGDGIGDFNGIAQKLDYLNDGDPQANDDLGITGIWMRPINPSSQIHGYCVTDYYGVNPDFGTLDDFKNLLAEAHKRGIRVITDLVLNHSSNEHPWFIAAQDPASPYHDWYIWSDTDPGYPGSWGQKVWFPLNGVYYYSTFHSTQPDLNYRNPAVTAEMENVMRFWLEDIGIDGFRLDAAKHIIEDGTVQANSDSTHQWYKNLRPIYKQFNPDSMLIPELWEPPDIAAKYLQGDELDTTFDFYLAFAALQSIKDGDATAVTDHTRLSYDLQLSSRVAPFLTSYDFDRLMTQFNGNANKVKVAFSMVLTLPGTPFVYYGEEIGQQGKSYEDARLPMQWSADANAGFSSTTPWTPLGPGWQTYNVANELNDPDSILSHVRSLIQIRAQHKALRIGQMSVLTTGSKSLYGILSTNEDEAVLVLVNITGASVGNYGLSVEGSGLPDGSYAPTAIMGQGEFAQIIIEGGGFQNYLPTVEVPPYSTYILQLRQVVP